MVHGSSVGTRIPKSLKLAHGLFLAVAIPFYWATFSRWRNYYHYDVSLVLTGAGIIFENMLLVSIPAVGIHLPQILWLLDLLAMGQLNCWSAFLFGNELPLPVRLFAGVQTLLPLLLLYLVRRLGYDRRAIIVPIILTAFGSLVAGALTFRSLTAASRYWPTGSRR